MALLVFIVAGICSILALLHLNFSGLFVIWMVAGLWLFFWYAITDAVKDGVKWAANQIPQHHEHFHAEIPTTSDDPTRPNENIPAIIEIGRQHYKVKP
jgi:hypothetical protein